MPAQPAALRSAQRIVSYHGKAPFPGGGEPPLTAVGRLRAGVTGALVIVPFAGLAAAVWLAWGHGLGLADVLLAAGFYVVTGLGVTVGFHQLLTHRSFTGSRPQWVALAVAGSMSFQGEVIGWVAIHRRHHAFTDRPGDPHSPYRYGTGPRQVDISAAVIRVFERLGWATAVRWPDPVRFAARRRPSAQDRPRAALPPPGR